MCRPSRAGACGLRDCGKHRERIKRGSFRAAKLIEPAVAEYHDPIVPDGKFRYHRSRSALGYEAELVVCAVVADVAADDCHLFCWRCKTSCRWRSASCLGFRYCQTMVWHKPGGFQAIGVPQYNREFITVSVLPIFVSIPASVHFRRR